MAESTYQRVTGRSYGLGGVTTLWLGEGHLLQVASMLVIETYRRWYLVEVQAIVARRSRKRMAWNLVWGIVGGAAIGISAGFLGLAVASAPEREAQMVLRVLAGLSALIGAVGALLMLINTALGPTCAVFIQTPHGLEPLGAPTRERAFDRLLARLRPQIEAAQRAGRPQQVTVATEIAAEAATGS